MDDVDTMTNFILTTKSRTCSILKFGLLFTFLIVHSCRRLSLLSLKDVLLVFILFYFNSSQNKTSENETMFLYFLRMFPDSLELHQDPFVSKYKMTLELHITLN